jgi:hypothetical protein
MKNFAKLLIMTHLLWAGALTPASAIEAKMSSFKMNSCASAKECIAVEAASAQGSQVRPLHRLTKPTVTLTKNDKKEIINADNGYVDLVENQLVLYKKEGRGVREISFNLTTLKRLELLHGDR